MIFFGTNFYKIFTKQNNSWIILIFTNLVYSIKLIYFDNSICIKNFLILDEELESITSKVKAGKVLTFQDDIIHGEEKYDPLLHVEGRQIELGRATMLSQVTS